MSEKNFPKMRTLPALGKAFNAVTAIRRLHDEARKCNTLYTYNELTNDLILIFDELMSVACTLEQMHEGKCDRFYIIRRYEDALRNLSIARMKLGEDEDESD